jgi:hypothetical protein
MPGDFHLAAYSESLGSVTDSDVDAVDDGVLQRRNSHLIFSEPYNLIAAYAGGSTLTRLNFTNSSLVVYGLPNIWPIEQADTVSANPPLYDLRDMPMRLPENEELTIAATTNAAGPIQTDVLLWLAAPTWTRNKPRGMAQLQARATVTTTGGGTGAWSNAVAITMQRDLMGGVYAVVGAHCFLAACQAFRLLFPRQRLTGGRQLRPGGLAQQAIANAPRVGFNSDLGEWGRFHTFELPSVQTYNVAGAAEVRLDLVYLGQSESLLAA